MILIGIAKENGFPWYHFTLMLYDRMINIALWTKRAKRPKYYYYSPETFKYMFDNDEVSAFSFKWFLGLRIG